MQPEISITWVISAKEAAYIFGALARCPYQEVNQLIGKLHKSTNDQVAQVIKGNEQTSTSGN